MAKRRRRAARKEPLPPPQQDSKPSAPQGRQRSPWKDWLRNWCEPFLLKPGEWRGVLIVGIVCILFFGISSYFTLDRGFHVDEVLTIREGQTRLNDENYQRQHGLFLDLYRDYMNRTSGAGERVLMVWRLPPIAASALGLFLTGLLAVRLLGSAAGVMTCIVILCLPRFWVSAMEMRFYGFMFFFAAVSLLGVAMAVRGRVLGGMILLGISSWLSYKFQPAAAPFHVVAGLIGLVAVCWHGVRGALGVRTWWASGRRDLLPRRHVWLLSVGLLCLIGAGIVSVKAYPEMKRSIASVKERRGNLPHEYIPDGWRVRQVIDHAYSWTPLLENRTLNISLRRGTGILFFIGVVALIGRKRPLLATMVLALWLLPHAMTFYLSWHVLFSIKYMSSTLPLLAAGVAMGLLGIGTLLTKTGLPVYTRWIPPGIGIVALVGAALMEIPSRLADDPSGAHRMARIAARDSVSGPPTLLAPAVVVMALEQTAQLGIADKVHPVDRDRIRQRGEASLALRPRDLFSAEYTHRNMREVAGIPIDSPAIHTYPEFRSSFNPRFNTMLHHLVADPVLAGGMAGKLVDGMPFAILEPGTWIVHCEEDATVTIGGSVYTNGDRLNSDSVLAETWTAKPPGTPVILRPDYSAGQVTRAGRLADSGDLYRYNRPMGDYWRLTNNLTVGYTLDLPEDPSRIVIETSGANPPGHAFMAKFSGSGIAQLHVNPHQDEQDTVEYHVQIPEERRGKRSRLEITMLTENAVNRQKDETVRTLDIRALRIEAEDDTGGPANTIRPSRFRQADVSSWPPGPNSLKNAQVLGENNNPLTAHVDGGRLVISLPRNCDSEAVLLETFHAPRSRMAMIECRMSTNKVSVSTVAVFAMFFNSSGEVLGESILSHRTVDHWSSAGTWRSGLLNIPPDAASAGIYLMLNRPSEYELEDGAQFIVEDIRVWELEE